MAAPSILVVHDQIIVAGELEARLTGFGYEVAGVASSGREAIALTAQAQPNLVLMAAAPDIDRRMIYSVARDSTERKQADEERETMVRALQAALAEIETFRSDRQRSEA